MEDNKYEGEKPKFFSTDIYLLSEEEFEDIAMSEWNDVQKCMETMLGRKADDIIMQTLRKMFLLGYERAYDMVLNLIGGQAIASQLGNGEK